MLCLAHNLGKWRTEALGLPVWRYRFDLVANNLNSLGASIGTFHGKLVFFVPFESLLKIIIGEDIQFVMGCGVPDSVIGTQLTVIPN